MAFDYDGRVVRFGENVYSWEFDELAALVAEAGGGVAVPPPTEDHVVIETEPEGAGGHFRLPGEPGPVIRKASPSPEEPEADGSPGEPLSLL